MDPRVPRAFFSRPSWPFRYRGRLDFTDIREILRKPLTPQGRADFSGEGTFVAGRLNSTGHYTAQDIALPYVWFHAGGFSSTGDYRMDNHGAEVPDFHAQALGGVVEGRVTVAFPGFQFHAETHTQSVSLAEVLAAVDHHNFPLRRLHWNAAVSSKEVTTWSEDFKHVESAGMAEGVPPPHLAPRGVPVPGRFSVSFSEDKTPGLVTSAANHTPRP